MGKGLAARGYVGDVVDCFGVGVACDAALDLVHDCARLGRELLVADDEAGLVLARAQISCGQGAGKAAEERKCSKGVGVHFSVFDGKKCYISFLNKE